MNDAAPSELAEPLPISFRCDVGAPMPTFVQTDYGAFLLFYLAAETPTRDWSSVNIRDLTRDRGVAMIQFKWCVAFMWGPGEERLHTHRLWGKGLGRYGGYVVQHSTWIEGLARLKAQNPNRESEIDWSQFKHYIFTFHDGSFEIVAETFIVRTFVASINEVLQQALNGAFYDGSLCD
jgi:hypothetical protein